MATEKTVKWKERSFLTLLTLMFIAILVGLTLIVHRFPVRFDLTEGGRHSLSAQSKQVVRKIKEEVHIRAFLQEGNPNKKKAQALLETYAYENPRITYQFIDPDRQPALARQYGVRHYGTLILESGGRIQNVSSADEEEITQGLLRLLQKRTKKVLFLSGHGEKAIQETDKNGYSMARGVLEKENYQVEEINLLAGKGIPEGTDCLVIAGPQKPLFPQEVEELKKYLSSGGRLLVLLEPFQDGGLKEWFSSLGITLHGDILIDKVSRIFGGDFLIPMAATYGHHPITEKFRVVTFFPTARHLEAASSPPSGNTLDPLVRTSTESWAEFNKARLERGEAAFDQGQDRKGPLTLALALTHLPPASAAGPEGKDQKGTSPPKGRMIVFGDSDFASNAFFNLGGNGDLFLNTVNYLTEEEQLIAVRPTKAPVKPLSLTRAQARLLFLISLVCIPLAVIGAGVWVWRLRRKAR